jgi:hypothetical protein
MSLVDKNNIFFKDVTPHSLIQGVPGGKASILGGHCIGHSNQNVRIYVLFRMVSEIELYHCTVPNCCSSDKVGTVYLV